MVSGGSTACTTVTAATAISALSVTLTVYAPCATGAVYAPVTESIVPPVALKTYEPPPPIAEKEQPPPASIVTLIGSMTSSGGLARTVTAASLDRPEESSTRTTASVSVPGAR
jgi:hypothetical protein